jgi:hypothetical protein
MLERQHAIRVEIAERGNQVLHGDILYNETLLSRLRHLRGEEDVEGDDLAVIARAHDNLAEAISRESPCEMRKSQIFVDILSLHSSPVLYRRPDSSVQDVWPRTADYILGELLQAQLFTLFGVNVASIARGGS